MENKGAWRKEDRNLACASTVGIHMLGLIFIPGTFYYLQTVLSEAGDFVFCL